MADGSDKEGNAMGRSEGDAILVEHWVRDGFHVFTSSEVAGLYVIDEDPERAFEQVAPSLEMLLHLSRGERCAVRPASSYQEFMRAEFEGREDHGDARAHSFLVS